MADRRKGAKSSKKKDASEEDKPSKLDYEVCKYLRNNLPEKRTMLLGHKVDYFISEKAIDLLLDSKWAVKQKGESEALFTSRESVVDFMERLLRFKMFHRAKVVVVQKSTDTKKKKGGDEESAADEPSKKNKRQKETVLGDGDESEKKEEKSSEKKKKEKKGKKKIKLDMHMEQMFVDGKESYVWIYDPIPLKTWFIGLGMVVGAILVCLFPLWPRIVRTYVYYLSVAAAGCLFFIIALALLRYVFFVIVWAVTFGKHHFWMLPNLTEDVGFFASFWPLYTHEYHGGDDEETKEHSSKEEGKEQSLKEGKGSKEKRSGKRLKSSDSGKNSTDEKRVECEESSVKDECVATEKLHDQQTTNNSSDEDNSSEASGSTSTNKSFEILDSKDLIESSGPTTAVDT